MSLDSLFLLAWAQLWQLTLLILATLTLNRWLVRDRPHLAHALWLVVLLKCLTPPVCASPGGVFCWLQPRLVNPASRVDVSPSSMPALVTNVQTNSWRLATQEPPRSPASAVAMPGGATTSRAASPRARLTGIWPTIFVLWLGGSLGLLLISTLRWWRCWNILRASPVESRPDLEAELDRLRSRLGVRTTVRLVVTASRIGPAVVGLWRPTILLPASIARDKSAEELVPILAHELIHIRRGDLWVGFIQVLAQAGWWFHPLVWVTNRLLSRDAERCCDEEVLAGLNASPARYARCLLDVLELKRQLRAVPVFPGVRPVEITSQRLERIMRLGHGCHKQTPWWCWIIMVLFAAATLPGAAFIAAEDPASPPAGTSPVTEPREWQPATKATPPNGDVSQCVLIEVHFVEGNGASIERLRPRWASNQHGKRSWYDVIDAKQTQELLEGIKANPELTISASPKVTAPIGQVVKVQAMNLLPLARDSDRNTLPNARFFPSGVALEAIAHAYDQKGIELECRVELSGIADRYGMNPDGTTDPTKPDGDPAAPKVPTLYKQSLLLSHTLPDGHSIVVPGVVDSLDVGQPAPMTTIVIRCQKLSKDVPPAKDIPRVPAVDEYKPEQPLGPSLLPKPNAAAVPSPISSVEQSDLLVSVYSVADLVIPVPKTARIAMDSVPAQFVVDEDRTKVDRLEPDFEALIQLIQRTISPDSWMKPGGSGSGKIDVIPQSLSIVVRQTAANHREIARLLKQLRAIQDGQFAMQIRLVTLAKDEVPVGKAGRDTASQQGDSPLAEKLSAKEVRDLYDTSRAKTRRLYPKVTLFQGQTLEVVLGNKDRPLIARVRPHLNSDPQSVALTSWLETGSAAQTKLPYPQIQHTLAADESLLLHLPSEFSDKNLGLGEVRDRSWIELVPYVGTLFQPPTRPDANTRLGLLVTPQVVYAREVEEEVR